MNVQFRNLCIHYRWQMADLREFDEYVDLNVNVDELPFYQSALKHFEDNGIPYRYMVPNRPFRHCDVTLK